jgi:hypothetical protein
VRFCGTNNGGMQRCLLRPYRKAQDHADKNQNKMFHMLC